VKHGRSFEAGRAAFRQTGCVQCHRFAGEGGHVGPDLTSVGQRLAPRDLLESILLPSKVIAEGFATTVVETKSGEVTAGRIEREDGETLVIRPLTADEPPVTVRKADIRSRTLSPTSNMPTGTVNVLSEAQIMDLLAWLISAGHADHAAFR
jgi:putative heme-binding domain-containing protein